MRVVTAEEKAATVCCLVTTKSHHRLCNLFKKKFYRWPFSYTCVFRWRNAFEEKRYLQRQVRKEKGCRAVGSRRSHHRGFRSQPALIVQACGVMFGTSVATISRASKANGLRPYKLPVCQRQTDDDKARRLSFCRSKLRRIAADPGHLLFLVFRDEAAFHLDG